jgi:hypothetical protein
MYSNCLPHPSVKNKFISVNQHNIKPKIKLRKEYFVFVSYFRKLKVKLYRPREALKVPGFEAPRIKDKLRMKLVRLSTLRPGRLYPQEIFLVLFSVRGYVEPTVIVRPEGLCQRKIQKTSPGKVWEEVEQCISFLQASRKCMIHLRVIYMP